MSIVASKNSATGFHDFPIFAKCKIIVANFSPPILETLQRLHLFPQIPPTMSKKASVYDDSVARAEVGEAAGGFSKAIKEAEKIRGWQ